jgi:glycosyltransferase involved in cell wall biosynthesis
MPTYNRANFLSLCLPPLFHQTYPCERYEIILVDDGSTDGTVERARTLADQWNGTFRIVEKSNGGAASARNLGYRLSNADIIAFIDSDCEADRDWLYELVRVLIGSNAVGVGGPIIDVNSHTWIGRYVITRRFFQHRIRRGRIDYLLTGSAAFRRLPLLEVGGFDERVQNNGEDPDLSFKLIQRGYSLAVTDKGSVIHHGTPPNLRAFIRTLYRYGYGNYLLSANWKNGRTPMTELIRHGGAVLLSPIITISLARRTSMLQAISFWPLVVLEHTAFIAGLLKGIFGGKQLS